MRFRHTAHPRRLPSFGDCYSDTRRRCTRRGGRAAEGSGLLNRRRVIEPYRGFESLPLRQAGIGRPYGSTVLTLERTAGACTWVRSCRIIRQLPEAPCAMLRRPPSRIGFRPRSFRQQCKAVAVKGSKEPVGPIANAPSLTWFPELGSLANSAYRVTDGAPKDVAADAWPLIPPAE